MQARRRGAHAYMGHAELTKNANRFAAPRVATSFPCAPSELHHPAVSRKPQVVLTRLPCVLSSTSPNLGRTDRLRLLRTHLARSWIGAPSWKASRLVRFGRHFQQEVRGCRGSPPFSQRLPRSFCKVPHPFRLR